MKYKTFQRTTVVPEVKTIPASGKIQKHKFT